MIRATGKTTCEDCRRAKRCCDGRTPCGRCVRLQLQCLHTERSRKRRASPLENFCDSFKLPSKTELNTEAHLRVMPRIHFDEAEMLDGVTARFAGLLVTDQSGSSLALTSSLQLLCEFRRMFDVLSHPTAFQRAHASVWAFLSTPVLALYGDEQAASATPLPTQIEGFWSVASADVQLQRIHRIRVQLKQLREPVSVAIMNYGQPLLMVTEALASLHEFDSAEHMETTLHTLGSCPWMIMRSLSDLTPFAQTQSRVVGPIRNESEETTSPPLMTFLTEQGNVISYRCHERQEFDDQGLLFAIWRHIEVVGTPLCVLEHPLHPLLPLSPQSTQQLTPDSGNTGDVQPRVCEQDGPAVDIALASWSPSTVHFVENVLTLHDTTNAKDSDMPAMTNQWLLELL
eukprot:TRINITY_DN7850_c0_g1_i2.p1 TRINITY_DN7850_c0_g1~~TRINITY_DN7850_c0_g1_i2.p1  ORF type:complete len:400 (+),score=57.03 TRINITY_DN7850_c0_g1_i2:99-1298(+)